MELNGSRVPRTLNGITENTVPQDFKMFDHVDPITLDNSNGQLIKKVLRPAPYGNKVRVADTVMVEYAAFFTNGVRFDSSKSR